MSDDFRCTMEHHLLGKYNCFVFSSFLMSNYFRCAMQHHLSEVHRLQLLFWLYMLFLGSPFLEFMTKREVSTHNHMISYPSTRSVLFPSHLLFFFLICRGYHLLFQFPLSILTVSIMGGIVKRIFNKKDSCCFVLGKSYSLVRCVLFGKFYSSDSSYELKTSVWVESTSVREVIAQYGLVPSMNRRRYRVASMKTSVRDAIVYHFHHLKIYMYLCYFKTLVILCYFETFVICILVLYYIGSNLILFFVYFVFIFR
ncbi:hypothetical protein HanXRQr2_Chr11g0511171 [Helianthus annuus]|nr:hypothetical protein HanXRQr2_Chr11g0511171 [Helianthus annuus]